MEFILLICKVIFIQLWKEVFFDYQLQSKLRYSKNLYANSVKLLLIYKDSAMLSLNLISKTAIVLMNQN